MHSEFNAAPSGRAGRHGCGSLDELFATLTALPRQGGAASYIYASWPELDSQAHAHGVASAAWPTQEEAFVRLLEAVRGSEALVLVTADRGLIDTPAEGCVDLAACRA